MERPPFRSEKKKGGLYETQARFISEMAEKTEGRILVPCALRQNFVISGYFRISLRLKKGMR